MVNFKKGKYKKKLEQMFVIKIKVFKEQQQQKSLKRLLLTKSRETCA